MISNDKRYNNILQLIIKVLENSVVLKNLNGLGREIIGDYDKSFFYASYSVQYMIDTEKIIYESGKKDEVFIGLDLNRATFLQYTDNDIKEIARESTYCTAFSATGIATDKLQSEIKPFTRNNITRGTEIEQTVLFNRLFKSIHEQIRQNKIDIHLKDGQFPSLSNRKLLPIVTFNPDKGLVLFHSSYRATVWNKDRSTYNIGDLKEVGKLEGLSRYLSVPIGLVEAKLTDSHIEQTYN